MPRAGRVPGPGRPLRLEGTATRWFRKAKTRAMTTVTVLTVEPGTGPGPDACDAIPFACSSCGRTDLPEAGDRNPPICQECDAAINEDELQEEYANNPW